MNYETSVEPHGRVAGADPLIQAEAEDRQSRKRTILIAVTIGIVLLIVAVWLLTRGGDEAAFAPSESQVPTVSVVAPGNTSIQGAINATGTIAARREMPVGVVGEGGRVVSVPVEAGQWVRSGQVLAVIDRSVQAQQAAAAAAQIEVAEADADLAQANLDRALQLVDRGFISRADVDRLTATRDAAVARVEVARAQYRELLARNERLNIVAPAAGLLLERNVEPGQVVGAGADPLFTIAKGGEMELLAQLGEDDLAAISVGAPATVTPVGTDQSFAGQVWQISPVIDPQNRQGTARIALGYERELRPGGFASAEIGRGAIVAPRLPESAIMSDEQGSYVYIVDADNKVVRRPVTTGLVTDEGIAIVSGLTGTERVILRAGGFLNPGDTVRPARVSADSQAGA